MASLTRSDLFKEGWQVWSGANCTKCLASRSLGNWSLCIVFSSLKHTFNFHLLSLSSWKRAEFLCSSSLTMYKHLFCIDLTCGLHWLLMLPNKLFFCWWIVSTFEFILRIATVHHSLSVSGAYLFSRLTYRDFSSSHVQIYSFQQHSLQLRSSSTSS